VKIELLRHATLILHYAGRRILVDPMLSDAGAMDPVANAANERRIPLVSFPFSSQELDTRLAQTDVCIVTHLHRDHWDAAARERLRKGLPIICQPVDAETIRSQGFSDVIPVESSADWGGLTLTRTGGEHGRGEIGAKMGPVSGFVLRGPGEPTVYIAGDTVWCPAVEQAIRDERPDVIIVNAGAAQFLTGGPITMDVSDVVSVVRATKGRVAAVHFEAVNHCLLSRAQLRSAIDAEYLQDRVSIPEDGAVFSVQG
jgi:L-ascorbate metabolism protein UlaG (beta-lactamase superfamily)